MTVSTFHHFQVTVTDIELPRHTFPFPVAWFD